MSRLKNSIFEQVQLLKPKRAKFDLSHERKMTIPFGALVPTLVSEVLPGDSFRVDAKILARFQAALAPFMHRVNVYTHYFYVPYRIVNRDFARFITYQGNRPNLSTDISQLPFANFSDLRSAVVNGAALNAIKDGSLMDYLGFPTIPNDIATVGTQIDTLRINMLLPLAYQRIWNDYYRDQNYTRPMFSTDDTGLENSFDTAYLDNVTNIDGSTCPDYETFSASNSTRIVQVCTLRWRAWEKDYLTSALPYANQGIGDPRVPITIPAGALGNTPAAGAPVPSAASTFGRTGGSLGPGAGAAGGTTDLGGFTISALRVASALKRWLENTARGGSRYAETLWHRWNVKHDDMAMQRAKYLGGGMQPMVISEVVTQAPATSQQTNVPAGYLAGHGISYGVTNRFTSHFKEHGVVMGITSILPRTSYLYSMPRAFMRTEPLDFASPEFAQIGEQPILGSEAFFKIPTSVASTSAPNYTAANSTNSYLGIVTRFPMGYQGASYQGFDLQNDNPEGTVAGSVWGYQSRYAEYKYLPDTVHGLFRNSQSFWHFGRMLSPNINLSNAFVTSNPRMDGFAVLPNNGATGQYNQHPIMLNVYNQVSCIRSLPYFNTPSLW